MNKEYKILEDTDLNNKIKCFFISIAFAFFEICENNEDSKIIDICAGVREKTIVEWE